jgi:hypothetical protein
MCFSARGTAASSSSSSAETSSESYSIPSSNTGKRAGTRARNVSCHNTYIQTLQQNQQIQPNNKKAISAFSHLFCFCFFFFSLYLFSQHLPELARLALQIRIFFAARLRQHERRHAVDERPNQVGLHITQCVERSANLKQKEKVTTKKKKKDICFYTCRHTSKSLLFAHANTPFKKASELTFLNNQSATTTNITILLPSLRLASPRQRS